MEIKNTADLTMLVNRVLKSTTNEGLINHTEIRQVCGYLESITYALNSSMRGHPINKDIRDLFAPVEKPPEVKPLGFTICVGNINDGFTYLGYWPYSDDDDSGSALACDWAADNLDEEWHIVRIMPPEA